MPQETTHKPVQALFAKIASHYDFGNTLLSLGMHHLWKRSFINMLEKRERAIALDLCTGTGDLVKLLGHKARYVVGLDFCLSMLKLANHKIQKQQALLVHGDALDLSFCNKSVDLITIAFGIRNISKPEQLLAEIHRVLKEDGELLILEFGQPRNMLWRAIFKVYSALIIPLFGKLIASKEAYTYLVDTSKCYPCGEDFEQILRENSFTTVNTQTFSGGIAWGYLSKK